MDAATRKPPIRYSPELEEVKHDEAKVIGELNEAFDKILETTSQDYGHAVRAVHAKGHGIVTGTLTVHDNLPPELAQGLFAKAGRHRVWMRFSTNAGDILDDSITLPRGLAIKVADVEGERLPGAEGNAQDFVLVNGPVFQTKDAKQFLGNLEMLAKTTGRMEGTKKALSAVLRGINTAMTSIGIESPKVQSLGGAPSVNPLGETYYSVTPFRFGDHVAKFSVAPVSEDLTALTGSDIPTGDDPNAIRHTMRREMNDIHGSWMLRVQLCRDVEKQPIEDPTVAWDEEISPFLDVATIEAGPQDSWEEGKVREVDDGMRFSIWTGLEAHRPLGNINRARRDTYRRSSDYRARFNGCPIREPTQAH